MKLYFYCILFIFTLFVHLKCAEQLQQEQRKSSPENFLADVFRPATFTTDNSNTPLETKEFYSLPSSPESNVTQKFPTNCPIAVPTLPPKKNSSSDWDDIEKKDIDRVKVPGKETLILVKGTKNFQPVTITALLRKTIKEITDPLKKFIDERLI